MYFYYLIIIWSMISPLVQAYPLMYWKYIHFDISMQKSLFPQAMSMTESIVTIEGNSLYTFMKELYDKINPSMKSPKGDLIIPKIIHQIWVGGDVPSSFKGLMQAWVDAYVKRGWQYYLWTDKEVESFDFPNKDFYVQTTNNGVKSDILKWAIIHKYGGVYVDVDFEPLAPLDLLHYLYDFYVGIQPLDTQFLQLGAALFAARPGHPILTHCIETIKDDWHLQGAPKKTGPVHFTKSFYATAGKNGSKDIAFPASYFYPLGCQQTILDYALWKKNGAYAVHHWAKSWMPIEYRPERFQDFSNAESAATWNT